MISAAARERAAPWVAWGGPRNELRLRLVGMVAAAAMAAAPVAAAPEADLIVHGGPVLTLDPAQPRLEAVAFRSGVVLAFGSWEEVLALRGPRTRELDLRGRVLMPSFKDHHVHLLNLGLALLNHERHGALQAELYGLDLERIAATLATRCHRAPPGSWGHRLRLEPGSLGRLGAAGSRAAHGSVPRQPGAARTGRRPCGWANRKALRFARAAEAEPFGSRVVGGERGVPAGALLERANEPLLARVPPLEDADVIAAFRKAAESLAARGVTQADDAGFLSPPGLVDLMAPFERYLALLVRADAAKPLPIRVGLMIPAPSALAERVLSEPHELSPRLRVTHLKLFADGALGSRGAALSHPYADDPSTHGVPPWTGRS